MGKGFQYPTAGKKSFGSPPSGPSNSLKQPADGTRNLKKISCTKMGAKSGKKTY